jgi:diguanylate cyclase (GGDEF)-like protein/PAS domain S-box-containing protein
MNCFCHPLFLSFESNKHTEDFLMASSNGSSHAQPRMRTRILLIEDVAVTAEIVEAYLDAAPNAVYVESVGSLGAALERIAGSTFDLIVVDLNLPDSKGLETLDRLAHATDRLIVVLTSEDSPQLRAAAIAHGAYDFLHKSQLSRASLDQIVRLATMQASTLRSLRESEARFRSFAQLGSDWYFEQDAELRFMRFDGRTPEQYKKFFKKFLGKRLWEIGHDCDGGWDDIRRRTKARLPLRECVHYRVQRDGTRRYFSDNADPVFDDTGQFTGYRGVGRDITDQKLAEERIEHRATHDGLTGLPNRAMFSALLEQALRSAKRYERKLGILFIDLDGFKSVNDLLGHEAGDSLLKQMAARFRDAVRSSDVVVRLGGDEFMVLAQELLDRDGISAVAQKVLGAVALPVRVAEQECQISASIGIAVFPDDGDSEQLLMKNADKAMYVAKQGGKNAFRFFS